MFFFFNDTATTEIYTLSLHDALPISAVPRHPRRGHQRRGRPVGDRMQDAGAADGVRRRLGVGPVVPAREDRKSTRLNSSHANISYAVFCLKKKKKTHPRRRGPIFPA